MAGMSKEQLSRVLSEAWNARGDEMRSEISRLADDLNGQNVTMTELPMILVTLSGKIAAVMVTQMADVLVEVISANNEALLNPPSTPEQ